MSPTNEDRADWAEKALKGFQADTGAEDEEAIADLVCDLLHLAARRGQDVETILFRARYNYDAEVEEKAIEDGARAPGA